MARTAVRCGHRLPHRPLEGEEEGGGSASTVSPVGDGTMASSRHWLGAGRRSASGRLFHCHASLVRGRAEIFSPRASMAWI